MYLRYNFVAAKPLVLLKGTLSNYIITGGPSKHYENLKPTRSQGNAEPILQVWRRTQVGDKDPSSASYKYTDMRMEV